MKLTSEQGFGAGAFLFLFVMAGLCFAAAVMRLVPIFFLGAVGVMILCMIAVFRQRKSKSIKKHSN